MTEREAGAPGPAGLMQYLKAAFFFRWNILALVGGIAAALISPVPDVVLPLVAAGELAYLAGLTSIPRFRAAIDARHHAQHARPLVPSRSTQSVEQTLHGLLAGLTPETRLRFDRLRDRCVSMQRIAHGVRGQAGPNVGRADDLRTPALDRLLWVFLRLLYSQQALKRFLAATDEQEMTRRLAEFKDRETAAEKRGDDRIVRSLKDSIATSQLRLENYHKAQSNAEFVGVELERIESKIQVISEMAVSHQDPDYISRQVDSVAESMAHTEEAIRELTVITGLTTEMEAAPQILDADLERVVES